MKVLVIGGTRYMGRLAVERFLERGDEVTVFSRGNTRPPWWGRVQHVLGDRHDPDEFIGGLRDRKFDAVIDTQAFRREDVESAGAALGGRVGRYLMVSTGSVYLDGKLDFVTHCPFREGDVDWADLDDGYPPGEDTYAVGKRHCEKWLQEQSLLPYTVIRVPAVMGWDDPTGRMWWWVQRALDGCEVVLPTDHYGVFRTLYSDDAAANWVRAIESPAAANEIIHIASEEVITPDRWVRELWRAAGHEGRIAWVPRALLEKDPALKDFAPPLTRSWPYVHDLNKAQRLFDFRTTPLADWFRTTVDWYRNHYRGADSEGYAHRQCELDLAWRWSVAQTELIAGF